MRKLAWMQWFVFVFHVSSFLVFLMSLRLPNVRRQGGSVPNSMDAINKSLDFPSADRADTYGMWQRHDGATDILVGVYATHVWLALGWHDIRQRYRRSVLGPFWFTLSTLILVGALGYLYSTFLHQDISYYLPYLGIGLVIWQYLSNCVLEGSNVFISSAATIKQLRIPLTVHVVRVVWRNFVIMMHGLPILLVLSLCFGNIPGPEIVLVLPGLLLLSANCVWVAIVLGILCTRFRDVLPIVGNLLQVAFFFTPIMWTTDLLKDRAWVAAYNPLHHLVDIVRAPLLGQISSLQSWLWATLMMAAGFALAQRLMKRYRDRVPYWL
jgi:lipopolysaccharide transport system permease protein